MIGNLADNACKWAATRVSVPAREQGAGTVAVEVEDDGPGLAAGVAEAVLERGRRLDEAVPGSGLGLTIVRELAALHGGRLELGRSAWGGLRATLSLPAAPSRAPR
jgi:signal transduction histidine kinase